MIISGYRKDDSNPNKQPVNESGALKELIAKDAILAAKVRNRQPVKYGDIEAARKRITNKAAADLRNREAQEKEFRESWDFLESLREHPLYNRRGSNRTLGALKEIKANVPLYSGYLIPGQIAIFRYEDPATKEDLEWWDNMPCTIFFGYFRNKEGKIRELGFNLHYFPPFTRKNILQRVFRLFKQNFIDNFDTVSKKKISGLSYRRMLASLRSSKLEVGVREYIPGLRAETRVIPTRYLPAACLTEGVFTGATVRQIYDFWKNFRR